MGWMETVRVFERWRKSKRSRVENDSREGRMEVKGEEEGRSKKEGEGNGERSRSGKMAGEARLRAGNRFHSFFLQKVVLTQQCLYESWYGGVAVNLSALLIRFI
ncbi:hypothetical protein E2C01_080703 [Portunus trituberculatus]|uniref:Uncharacterized protein n=1 Tax=Portunus trituberculatus TaxID=210409 RepID=A0A5B7J0B1_PORTR|nr:hypothetical protein [Portunus trituberculatus]